jgi:hypothetical protein
MNYFENNYVLAALAGLAVSIFVFIDRKRNASVNREPVNFFSYIKIFLAVFSITLGILFYKTKNFSLPIPPKGLGQLGGASSAFRAPVHPLVQMRTQTGGAMNVAPRVDSYPTEITKLDLECVNIGEPNF